MKDEASLNENIEKEILDILSNVDGKMPDEIQLLVETKSDMTIKEFRKKLNDMQNQGIVMQTQRGKWAIPARIGFIVGKIQRNQKGFGFLIPFDKEMEDIFVAPNDLNGAMNDDTVIVNIKKFPEKGKMKTEGIVYKIIQRSQKEIVGILELIPSGGFIVPDNNRNSQDIYIPKGKLNGGKDGEKVVAKIVEYPKNKRSPVGEVLEVLGNAKDVGVDILSIIKSMGLRESFSNKLIEKAEKLSQQDLNDYVEGRKDFRKLKLFTIDGADSKDFDDAVSIERLPKNLWRLGVHIADVSHYVVAGSNIDKEAYERATSVYLVDRVLPMLPESLSNGICSLKPNIDRLAMSCVMDIDKNGEVINYEIVNSIISSYARLTYDQVNSAIEGDKQTKKELKDVLKELGQMNDLAKILNKKRNVRGSLELDIDEPHIQLGDDGVPISISARTRGDSQKLIEEFMLCANETVAKHILEAKKPCMYRVHGQPDPKKMQEFGRFANNLGYILKGEAESVSPRQLQDMLNQAKNKPEVDVLHRVLLRTLQKAIYSPKNEGHYGLASECYCHFTSPIRRYPDLIVHRVLKAMIAKDNTYIDELKKVIDPLAEHCSENERTAMEAERKVDDLKMTEYMTYHLNEVFEAIVSGVTEYGFYVELENTIEGLVHVNQLNDDYYVYYEKAYMLKGERKGKEFRLGDKVLVECTKADVAMCNIDFAIAEKPQEKE